MTRLGKVVLGVVLGLGLAVLVRPWVAELVHEHPPARPTMVGGF